MKSFLGWDGYDHAWNLVKYALGSHDDIGDLENGDAEHGLTNWDKRHRYFVDQLGGRENWWARAKCRLAWALNVAMPGTPMLFMGSECHMASPHVAWGYWHDGRTSTATTDSTGALPATPSAWKCADSSPRQCGALGESRAASRFADRPARRSHNQVLGFVRELYDNVVLTVVNLSDRNFTGHELRRCAPAAATASGRRFCARRTRRFRRVGRRRQRVPRALDAGDGQVYINLPKWSVVMLRRK